MRIRNVLKEFEAHINSILPESSIQGKSEWKQYGDGTFRFKISVRNIWFPDDSVIDVMLDEKRIFQTPVQNNRIKVDVQNSISIGIPPVKDGCLLEIKFRESVLAEGRYVEE
jgi:hypothetical protein